MSELERLIQELCPNGVKYLAVGELIKRKIIKTITPTLKIKRNDYKESGNTPIISQEAEYISGYCNSVDKNIPTRKYVCFGDHSEHLKYVDFAFVQGADGLKIMHTDENILLARYFYHSTSCFYKRHNNYERHFKYFCDTFIPVPPLEVQGEIVRILDNFTELTAELTARKKQHEYYRDFLFANAKGKTNITLDKISKNCDSQRKPVTSGKREAGNIPYYGASGIVDYVKDYIFDGDYLLVSEDGANLLARSTPIAFSISGKTWVNNHAHILKFGEYATRRYVEIYLRQHRIMTRYS